MGNELLKIIGESPDEKKMMNRLVTLFHDYGVLRKYQKNSFIFSEGDQPEALYHVERGLLKVSQSTMEGQNITFYIRKPGDVFGMSEIILQHCRQRYVQCLTDCDIWVLESHAFFEVAKKNDSIINLLLLIITKRFLETQRNIEILMSKPVPWRLAWVLKHLGDDSLEGEYTVNLKLTHEEFSNIIGCSRQTITETFNNWNKKDLISYNKKRITIKNMEQLLS